VCAVCGARDCVSEGVCTRMCVRITDYYDLWFYEGWNFNSGN